MEQGDIPKIIWIYWADGFEEAPLVVKHCAESWRSKNPRWKTILLHDANLSEYVGQVDMPQEDFEKLPIQKRANLIRLKLLVEHGGVWADATCYCTKALDEWLSESAPTGFFMFYKPGRDRIISNWFIVSSPQNYLVKQLYKERCSYWENHDFNHESYLQKHLTPFLSRVINRHPTLTRLWFNPLFERVLKIYPYHVFHFAFYRLVKRDKKCAEIWRKTKKISADGPHLVQKMGMLSELSEDAGRALEQCESPLFKLDYRFDGSKLKSGTLLHHLLANY